MKSKLTYLLPKLITFNAGKYSAGGSSDCTPVGNGATGICVGPGIWAAAGCANGNSPVGGCGAGGSPACSTGSSGT